MDTFLLLLEAIGLYIDVIDYEFGPPADVTLRKNWN